MHYFIKTIALAKSHLDDLLSTYVRDRVAGSGVSARVWRFYPIG